MLRKLNTRLDTKGSFSLLIGIAIVVAATTLILVNKTTFNQPFVAVTPSKKLAPEIISKVVPLAHGKQTYFIKTGKPRNPQILQVDLDPLDVKIGKEQILTVYLKHSTGEAITSKNAVTAIYHTDNGSSNVSLKLKKAEGNPLETTWQGVWIPEDSYEHTYSCSIVAKSAEGQSRIDLTFR